MISGKAVLWKIFWVVKAQGGLGVSHTLQYVGESGGSHPEIFKIKESNYRFLGLFKRLINFLINVSVGVSTPETLLGTACNLELLKFLKFFLGSNTETLFFQWPSPSSLPYFKHPITSTGQLLGQLFWSSFRLFLMYINKFRVIKK